MTRFSRWSFCLSTFVTIPACYVAASRDDAGADTSVVATDTPLLDAPVLDTSDDARIDARSGMTDVPVATGCGLDGLPCVTIGFEERPANMVCLGTERAPSGDERLIAFNLVERGTSSNDTTGDFELWHTNFVGLDCAAAAPDCEVVSDTEVGNTMKHVGGGWYAYRVAANTAEGTFETLGYNRRPAGAGGVDTITSIDVGVYSAILRLIRRELALDREEAILLGDAVDCDGASVEGVTARLFREDGEEIAPGTDPADMGLAYRRDGALPHPDLQTTDQSGGYLVANVRIPPDRLLNVVTYGTLREGAARGVIGCEQVSVAAGVVTIVGVGPLRSDYPVDSFCATVSE